MAFCGRPPLPPCEGIRLMVMNRLASRGWLRPVIITHCNSGNHLLPLSVRPVVTDVVVEFLQNVKDCGVLPHTLFLLTLGLSSLCPARSVLGQSSCRLPQLQLHAHPAARVPQPPVVPAWNHPGISMANFTQAQQPPRTCHFTLLFFYPSAAAAQQLASWTGTSPFTS